MNTSTKPLTRDQPFRRRRSIEQLLLYHSLCTGVCEDFGRHSLSGGFTLKVDKGPIRRQAGQTNKRNRRSRNRKWSSIFSPPGAWTQLSTCPPRLPLRQNKPPNYLLCPKSTPKKLTATLCVVRTWPCMLIYVSPGCYLEVQPSSPLSPCLRKLSPFVVEHTSTSLSPAKPPPCHTVASTLAPSPFSFYSLLRVFPRLMHHDRATMMFARRVAPRRFSWGARLLSSQ